MRYTTTPGRIASGPGWLILTEIYALKLKANVLNYKKKSRSSKLLIVEKKRSMILLPISSISIKVHPKRESCQHWKFSE